jgi:hypothetical protein
MKAKYFGVKSVGAAVALLCLVWCAPAYAQVSDHFTGANGDPLAGHSSDSGGSWINVTGVWTIQSNRASTTAFIFGEAVRSETAFPDDQYAEILTEMKTTDTPITRRGGACGGWVVWSCVLRG